MWWEMFQFVCVQAISDNNGERMTKIFIIVIVKISSAELFKKAFLVIIKLS